MRPKGKWKETVWLDIEVAMKLKSVATQMGKASNVVAAEVLTKWIKGENIVSPAEKILEAQAKGLQVQEARCKVCGNSDWLFRGSNGQGDYFYLCKEHYEEWARRGGLNKSG